MLRRFVLKVFAIAAVALGVQTAPALAGIPTCSGGVTACLDEGGSEVANFLSGIASALTGGSTGEGAESGSGDGDGDGEPLSFAPEPFSPASYVMRPDGTPIWKPWIDTRATYFDSDDGSGLDGHQLNVTAGIGRHRGPTTELGVLGGFEKARTSLDAALSSIESMGGTFGGYFKWYAQPNWKVVGVLAGSALSHDVSLGGATGSYNSRRAFVSLSATGRYAGSKVIWEPSARIFAFHEDRDEWTDTDTVVHEASSGSFGRASIGGRAIHTYGNVSPYAGLYADWHFTSEDFSSLPGASDWEGGSLRVNGGVTAALSGKTDLTVQGEVEGIGSSFNAYSLKALIESAF